MCCSSVLYLENDTCHFRHSLWARTSHVALPNLGNGDGGGGTGGMSDEYHCATNNRARLLVMSSSRPSMLRHDGVGPIYLMRK